MDNRRQFEAFFATADGLAKLVDSLFSVSWVDAVKGKEFIRMLFHQFIHKIVRYRLSLRLIPLQEIARHFPHVDHSSRNENRLVDPCLPHLRQEKIFVTIILACDVGMSIDDHVLVLLRTRECDPNLLPYKLVSVLGSQWIGKIATAFVVFPLPFPSDPRAAQNSFQLG